MRGIVFTELIELVEAKFGEEVADRLQSLPGLSDSGGYSAVVAYPHGELLALVAELSRITGIPEPALSQAFGEHFFGRLATRFPFAVSGHTDLFAFLSTIDGIIHQEVLKLHPGASLPSVPVQWCDGATLVLDYRSPRPFADVAEGLLRGAARWFGEECEITREPLGDDPQRASRFTITRKARTP